MNKNNYLKKLNKVNLLEELRLLHN